MLCSSKIQVNNIRIVTLKHINSKRMYCLKQSENDLIIKRKQMGKDGNERARICALALFSSSTDYRQNIKGVE